MTTIIQVGDFWIYDRPKEPVKLERIITRVCRDAKIDPDLVDYRFIDGNHENFNWLTSDASTPVQVSEHVTYMPRGTRARLAGAEILFCGGASSTDRAHRTEGKTWWPVENITDAQLGRALDTAEAGPVDVLVPHETTTAAFAELCATGGHALDKLDDPAGDANRARLDQLVAAASPRALVHGHHHTRHAGVVDGVQVVSLSLEIRVGAVAILDTDAWTWRVAVGRRDTGADEPLWNGETACRPAAAAVVDCASLTSAVGPDGPAETPPPCDAPWARPATTPENEPHDRPPRLPRSPADPGRRSLRARLRGLWEGRVTDLRTGLRSRLGLPATDVPVGRGLPTHLRPLRDRRHRVMGAHHGEEDRRRPHP